MSSPFETELGSLIDEYESALRLSKYSDGSDVISDVKVREMQTRCLAGIERAVGRGSVYYDQAERVLRGSNNQLGYLAGLIGVVESLLHNMRAGYIHTLEELVHGEVFGDFLEMAQYLLDKGYKDAAAVMAGSTLEAHLRQLCKKVGISVGAGGHPKRADRDQ